jgi:16S rRNA (uracil1498-N3)-methyltransferase
MTRRRFYAPPAAFNFSERIVTLPAEEARHVRDVLRLRAGDEVYVFDAEGREFRCTLGKFIRAGAILELQEETQPAQPESRLQLTLGIALLKGEKFDLVIQKTVELGVTRIVPLLTDRSEVRLTNLQSTQKRLSRWQRLAVEAAKQSGRAYVPRIVEPVPVISFLHSTKPEGGRFFLAERGGESLRDGLNSDPSVAQVIAAVVGPEGGWSDQEITAARQANWQIVTLGGRILRAETAAIAIVTLLQHRFGDLN